MKMNFTFVIQLYGKRIDLCSEPDEQITKPQTVLKEIVFSTNQDFVNCVNTRAK